MNPTQFSGVLNNAQRALKDYVNYKWTVRAGEMGLRFIDGNFRAQGFQGRSFQYWKPNKRNGTILIKRGILRRGYRYAASMAQSRIYNNVPYAKVHNEGFRGSVNVRTHERRNFQANRVATGRLTKGGKPSMKTVHTVKSVSMVKAHTMKMNIAKRQMAPASLTDSPVLANAIKREIERAVKQIFS